MVEPQTPRRPKRFAEPEISSPIAVWRSMLAASVSSIEKRRAYRTHDPRLEMFGIIVLAPAFVVLTVVILLMLLAIFVMWLCVVGVLLSFLAAFAFPHIPAIGNLISFKPSVALIAPILGAAFALCLLGSLLPAWWAVRMVPAEALRRL